MADAVSKLYSFWHNSVQLDDGYFTYSFEIYYGRLIRIRHTIMIISKLRDSINSVRTFIHVYRQWQRLSHQLIASKPVSPHLVIIPCDPWSVGGSRGDEAMISAVIQQFRERYPNIPIDIITEGDMGMQYISNLHIAGVTPRRYWTEAYPLERIYKKSMALNPSHVVIVGADCMDGYYSPFLSLMLLALYDLFDRSEAVECNMLGYSFNSHPSYLVKMAFRHGTFLSSFPLRDSISMERFTRMCHKKSHLVADVAFILSPEYAFDGYLQMEHWVKEQRSNGIQHIIGFNFHPMLRTYKCEEEVRDDALLLAKNVVTLLQKHGKLAFVFIPHDERCRLGDNLMLFTMAEYVRNCGYGNRLYYDKTIYRADQLKGLCRLLDGLVSSRMHLAIAALGQGKSVMAVTYQDKFEGLYQHFDLPQEFLLHVSSLLSEAMIPTFDNYLQQIDRLTKQVEIKLPDVIKLSEKNLM